MSLIANAEYLSVESLPNHYEYLVCPLRGAKALSLIIECLDSEGNERYFPEGAYYEVAVADEYEPPKGDRFSYYNVMIKKDPFIVLRTIPIASNSSRITNSFTERFSIDGQAQILHFKYSRFLLPDLGEGIRCRLTASIR